MTYRKGEALKGMDKVTRKLIDKNGNVVRKREDMRKLLNFNYLYLTDRTHLVDPYGIPAVYCNTNTYPDYLALYSQKGYYHKTATTAVCFYQFDRVFDGIHGIYNAIYHGEKRLLDYYKRRFHGVHFFISPDYSMFDDVDVIGNLYQLKKSRIVSLWLSMELGAVVIPNLSCVSEDSFETYFSGLERCSVAAVSLKGHIRRASERRLITEAIKYAVKYLPLKALIVYSVCGKDETTHPILRYAVENGVEIVIPNNSLRESNKRRCCL